MKTASIIPVFYVSNVDDAVRYYTSVLGFTESFRYGSYAGLRMGPCELHVTDPGEPREISGAGCAYLLCDEVDTYFGVVKKAGARLKNEPTDRVYGMRDFSVFDLDGNQISFGCDVGEV